VSLLNLFLKNPKVGIRGTSDKDNDLNMIATECKLEKQANTRKQDSNKKRGRCGRGRLLTGAALFSINYDATIGT